MKKLLLVLLLVATSAFAQAPQYGRFYKTLTQSSAPTQPCNIGTLIFDTTAHAQYVCGLSNVWYKTGFDFSLGGDNLTLTPSGTNGSITLDPTGTGTLLSSNASTFTAASRKAISPTTDTLAAFKLQDGGGSSTGWFDTTADGVRTYGLYINMARPTSGVFAATAGVDDAGIRVSLNNYANTHSNYIMRGLNISLNNRADATLGQLEAASIGVQNRNGNSTATTLSGLTTTIENYSSNAITTAYGIKIDMRDESGVGSPTTTGLIINNSDNSTSDALTYGAHLSDAGTNTGFTNGFSTYGATVVCEFQLKGGACLYSGAQTTRNGVRGEVGTAGAIGSLYLSTAGKLYLKVANAGAEADWEKVTSSAAD